MLLEENLINFRKEILSSIVYDDQEQKDQQILDEFANGLLKAALQDLKDDREKNELDIVTSGNMPALDSKKHFYTYIEDICKNNSELKESLKNSLNDNYTELKKNLSVDKDTDKTYFNKIPRLLGEMCKTILVILTTPILKIENKINKKVGKEESIAKKVLEQEKTNDPIKERVKQVYQEEVQKNKTLKEQPKIILTDVKPNPIKVLKTVKLSADEAKKNGHIEI